MLLYKQNICSVNNYKIDIIILHIRGDMMGKESKNSELNELLDLICKIESDTAIRRLKMIVKDYLNREEKKKQYH